jgi:hypothetical protein
MSGWWRRVHRNKFVWSISVGAVQAGDFQKVLIERLTAWGLCLGIAFSSAAAFAQNVPVKHLHDSGQSITASYEGWFQNKDRSFSILFGYYNRNEKQVLDIPIGPQNRIEPGGPDQGQPTHFLIRRQWGVFTVTVPKDFGDNKLTWTVTANGQTTTVPASLNPLWEISPLLDADGNAPPLMRLGDGGAVGQGPLPIKTSLNATMETPAELSVWVADDARMIPGGRKHTTPPIVLTWSKFRGPGAVTFENIHPAVEREDPPAPGSAVSGLAKTTAAFSEPGEYVLEVVANDWTGLGGRGFLCCWTNGLVKVSVK